MNKTCGSCGTSRSTNQFYKLPNGEYSHICKVCVNKQVKEYYEQLDSYSAALWLVLAKLNVPFFQEQWKDVEAMIVASGSNRKPDLVLNYLRSLAESGKVVHGFWQSDTMLDQIIDTVVDRDKEVEEEMDLVEQQEVWGKFLVDGKVDVEAYKILNRSFSKYTKDLEVPDENYEERIRDLCRCELRLRRANESGDGGEITKAQDSLNKQLTMLKMNDFQSKQLSDEKRAFEYNVSLIENYRPAECEKLQEYLDMVGYEKEKAILMRSIRNAIAETREYPDIPKEYR